MKLNAQIVPINGRKYYGTEIKLTAEDGRESSFSVWVNGLSPDGFPSEREYDFVGADGKAYLKGYEEEGESYEFEIYDDHYETQTAYDVATAIVKALNGIEIK